MTASLPARYGRYEVLGLLGQGGMGAVYKARDPDLDRVVALKTINPLLLSTASLRQEYLERFRREARAAGRLCHPGIVSVYDLGLDEATGTPFIVMEYVDGITLEAVLGENASVPADQGVEIVEQVAAALAEAHRHGVIHRDVKPSNVYLDARGRVKVGDFGVARVEGSELTQTGVGLGTPGYLAPELVRGGTADARSDVFALGVLAYRVLTGRRPFAAVSREAAAVEVIEKEPPPPLTVRAGLPAYASAAVMHALAKSPRDRTPSAEAFAQELTGRSAIAPAMAPPGAAVPAAAPITMDGQSRTVTVATVSPIRRRWRRAALAAAAVVALLILGVLIARSARPREASATPHSPSASPRTPSPPPRPPRGPVASPAAVTLPPAARPRLPEVPALEDGDREDRDGGDDKGSENSGGHGRGKGKEKKGKGRGHGH